MAQSKKGKLNYRCPSCFARDIDMDMFYDEEKGEYYCIRCGYVGKEEDVLKANEEIKKKYKHINDRVVDLGEDDKDVIYKKHIKGEF
jgi:Zn ribbon nucleic-acid-binding protein